MLATDFKDRPYAKTFVTIEPDLITKRTLKNVLEILDGVRVAPYTGDARLISDVLMKLYNIPMARVQRFKKGVGVQYKKLPAPVVEQLNPFYIAERTAIRLDSSDRRRRDIDLGWGVFSKNYISPIGFDSIFEHVPCYDEVLAVFQEYLKPHRDNIAQAKNHLLSNTPINYQFGE